MFSDKASEYFQLVWAAIKGKEQDYTTLGIRRSIVLLAIPMILEMLMESLFAVVDIFFVGRLGADALATVGLTESILMLIYAVGMGISIAATAMVSRRYGEKNYHKAGNITFQLLVTGTGLAFLLGAVAFYFAPEILTLMGATPGSSIHWCYLCPYHLCRKLSYHPAFPDKRSFPGSRITPSGHARALDCKLCKYSSGSYPDLRHWFVYRPRAGRCCLGYNYRQKCGCGVPALPFAQR